MAKVKAKPTAEPKQEFGASVYIGPTIFGTIQTVTIYPGTKEQALANPELALALSKYPGIADLVVSAEGLLEKQREMNTSGTELNKALRALKEAVRKR